MKKPDFHAEFVEACMLASGYANMCGYHAAARQIAELATCDKKTLTAAGKDDTIKTTAQQGDKQEGKTMKRYKWVKHSKNWNNRGYSLHDTATGKNIAWIAENNYCDYTVCASDYISAEYRYPHTLAETMEACAKSAGINPEEIEEYK